MARRVKRVKKANTKKTMWWLLLFTLVTFLALAPELRNIWNIHRQILELEAKKQELLAENKRLKKQEKMLYTDKMIEKLAREKLGMIKPGEKILIPVVPAEKGKEGP